MHAGQPPVAPTFTDCLTSRDTKPPARAGGFLVASLVALLVYRIVGA